MIGFAIRHLGPLLLTILIVGGLFLFGHSSGSASVQRTWDADKARQVAAQLAATEQARAVEQQLQAKVQEAQRNGQLEKARSERAAALLRADADRVRSEFAAYIRGPANDTITACVARGEATGLVLSEAIRVAGEMAEAGEQCETDKRTLIAAWPK